MTDEYIRIVDDPDFRYYKELLSQYPLEIQYELGYRDQKTGDITNKDPEDVEIAFAAVIDNKPYAWASLVIKKLGDQRVPILYAPMLIGSNYEIPRLMENRIREETKLRGLTQLLHIGLMPQVAASFGFKPTNYNALDGKIDFCKECERGKKVGCQPMIMTI